MGGGSNAGGGSATGGGSSAGGGSSVGGGSAAGGGSAGGTGGGSDAGGGPSDAGTDAGPGDAGVDGGPSLFDAGGFVFDAGCDPLDGGCGYDGGVDNFCALLSQFECGREATCNHLALAQWNECTSFVDRWCLNTLDPSTGPALYASPVMVAQCLSGTLNQDCRIGQTIDLDLFFPVYLAPNCPLLYPPQAPNCSNCPNGNCTQFLDAGDPCVPTGPALCPPRTVCLLDGGTVATCQPWGVGGATCATDSECVDHVCNSGVDDAGSHFCGPAPVGSDCTLNQDCTTDAYCDSASHCAARLSLGAACDPTLDYGDSCVDGGCRGGVCVELGALQLGSACMTPSQNGGAFECAAPFYCKGQQGSSTCQLRQPWGHFPCGADDECQPGLACDPHNTCNPPPRAGQACDHVYQSHWCSEMLDCVDTLDGGFCEPFPPVGTNCADLAAVPTKPDYNVFCLDSNGDFGFCTPFGTGFFCLAHPPPADGQSCSPNNYPACMSGSCSGGVCAPACP